MLYSTQFNSVCHENNSIEVKPFTSLARDLNSHCYFIEITMTISGQWSNFKNTILVLLQCHLTKHLYGAVCSRVRTNQSVNIPLNEREKQVGGIYYQHDGWRFNLLNVTFKT